MNINLISYDEQGRPCFRSTQKGGKRAGRKTKILGEIKNCLMCGMRFFASCHEIKRGDGLFCSVSCSVKKENNPNYRGGKFEALGYVHVLIPTQQKHEKSSYALEHRIIIETKFGRKLNEDEVVHHLNGIKTDNRIENLTIMSQPEHAKLHGYDDGPRSGWFKKSHIKKIEV